MCYKTHRVEDEDAFIAAMTVEIPPPPPNATQTRAANSGIAQ